jgi:hypothetical protein
VNNIILVGLNVNHHTLYDYILKLILKYFAETRFITQTEIFNQINIKNDKLKLTIDDSRFDLVIKNNLKLINTYDILILDEYYGPYFRMSVGDILCKKKVLIVHNANKWTSLLKNPFNINFIDQIFKINFTKQIDAFITLGPNVKKHFLERKNNKPVFFLPFDYPFNAHCEQKNR